MMAMEMPISLRENPSPPTVKNNDKATRLQRRHTPACFTIIGMMRPPRLVPRPSPFFFFSVENMEAEEHVLMNTN